MGAHIWAKPVSAALKRLTVSVFRIEDVHVQHSARRERVDSNTRVLTLLADAVGSVVYVRHLDKGSLDGLYGIWIPR